MEYTEIEVKSYSVTGMVLCIVYVLLCIGIQISVSGDVWDYSRADYSMSGGIDDVMYMGWFWAEVSVASVVFAALVAVSFILPRFAYFLRLWKTGSYDFWLIDVHSNWAKAGCLLYDFINLSLIFSLLMMIVSKTNYGVLEGEVVHRNDGELLYFIYMVFVAPVYWVASLIIRSHRKLKLP